MRACAGSSLLARYSGSSPLTRGTRSRMFPLRSDRRFIPAYAGNSTGTTLAALSQSVHPRLRGELCQRIQRKMRYRGSSPLTRGTPVRFKPSFSLIRFIPAYAGNSTGLCERNFAITVHPRLRGELCHSELDWNLLLGSSPLTRGTHLTATGAFLCGRFIPAYAGNSYFRARFQTQRTVHPRLRGELGNELLEAR